jgi:hypothetical protein
MSEARTVSAFRLPFAVLQDTARCRRVLTKGNGEDLKVVQELMRHANISVTLNIYAQAITQTKRDAQSRVVSLLLDKNEEKTSTEAYRTLTDVQNSGGDLQVVDKVGVPDGI